MGYSGGTYIRPIKSGADKIAQLYLDGKRQVTAIRDQVRQQRSAEMNAYAKVASQIEATGVAEADKLYQSGANQLREMASQAHRDNILGLTSRSMATAKLNNLTAQASQLANASKLVAKNTEALDKGILDNKLDALSKAGYLRGWFTGKQSMKIPDGKGGFTTTNVNQTLTTEIVDDNLHFRKTVNYYDPQSKKVETMTHLVPVGDLGDLSSHLIQKFDDVSEVSDFMKGIGKKEVEYIKGKPEDANLGYYKIPGQDDMYARIINPASFNNIINFMENDLNELAENDDNVLSFLSTNYGARGIGDDGFKGFKTQEQLQKILGATQVVKDGKPTGETIPKHYDELGNQIELEKAKNGDIIDPFVLQRDQNGNYVVTKTQREFFKARMRDKFLASMNITVDTFRNREEILKENQKTQDASGTPFVYSKEIKGDDDKTTILKTNIDYDFIRSIMSINNKYITNQIRFAQREEAEMSKKGYVLGGNFVKDDNIEIPKGAMPTIGQDYFEENDKFEAVSLGDNWNKLIKDSNMKVTTIHNGVMDSPSALMYNEKESGKISFFFVGNSTLIKPKSAIEMAISVKGREDVAQKSTEFARTGEINTTGVAQIKSADVSRVYKMFYKNDPTFQQIMEASGYNKDGYNNLSEKTDYEHALYTYIKSVNRK